MATTPKFDSLTLQDLHFQTEVRMCVPLSDLVHNSQVAVAASLYGDFALDIDCGQNTINHCIIRVLLGAMTVENLECRCVMHCTQVR
jgi:hypothetical protein